MGKQKKRVYQPSDGSSQSEETRQQEVGQSLMPRTNT